MPAVLVLDEFTVCFLYMLCCMFYVYVGQVPEIKLMMMMITAKNTNTEFVSPDKITLNHRSAISDYII